MLLKFSFRNIIRVQLQIKDTFAQLKIKDTFAKMPATALNTVAVKTIQCAPHHCLVKF